MKTKQLPPYAPTLIESTRAIGYTLEAAIADVIDNSITALSSRVDIFFFPVGESYIAILDDGCGMNADELDNAMRYGSQNPNEKREANDLGRFGLGLKTASLSQCRTLTVVTKQGEHLEARRWDIDHVIEKDDWSLLILDSEEEFNAIPRIDELRKRESGTLVVWENLDRLKIGEINFSRSMARKMDDARTHLSLVFHRYIAGEVGIKRLALSMNNVAIESADPFLVKRNTKIMSDEILNIEGSNVVINSYILPHVSNLSASDIATLGGKEGLRKQQGFYVYRNKRLLIWGTWFRMIPQAELSKLARVQVDIPNELDALWTLDIKKSTAVPPEEVRNNLGTIIERLAKRSKYTSVYRGKKETSDSIVHVWQRHKGRSGGSFYSINRDHPIVEILFETAPSAKRTIESLIRLVESNLPLNSLYVDLNSDNPIENDMDTTTGEIELLLKGMLENMPT
ncbi:MAG: ATP-binding protein, partial [Defluviitaleaceae bacterium]|nr:ATP-binding protein [Defluviitaleaceae bacterium]